MGERAWCLYVAIDGKILKKVSVKDENLWRFRNLCGFWAEDEEEMGWATKKYDHLKMEVGLVDENGFPNWDSQFEKGGK